MAGVTTGEGLAKPSGAISTMQMDAVKPNKILCSGYLQSIEDMQIITSACTDVGIKVGHLHHAEQATQEDAAEVIQGQLCKTAEHYSLVPVCFLDVSGLFDSTDSLVSFITDVVLRSDFDSGGNINDTLFVTWGNSSINSGLPGTHMEDALFHHFSGALELGECTKVLGQLIQTLESPAIAHTAIADTGTPSPQTTSQAKRSVSRRHLTIGIAATVTLLGMGGVLYSWSQSGTAELPAKTTGPIQISELIDARKNSANTFGELTTQPGSSETVQAPVPSSIPEPRVLLEELSEAITGLSADLRRIEENAREQHAATQASQQEVVTRLGRIESATQAQKRTLIALEKAVSAQRAKANVVATKTAPKVPSLVSVLRISGLLSARFDDHPMDVFIGDRVGPWEVKAINFDSQQVTLRSGKTARVVSVEQQ